MRIAALRTLNTLVCRVGISLEVQAIALLRELLGKGGAISGKSKLVGASQVGQGVSMWQVREAGNELLRGIITRISAAAVPLIIQPLLEGACRLSVTVLQHCTVSLTALRHSPHCVTHCTD